MLQGFAYSHWRQYQFMICRGFWILSPVAWRKETKTCVASMSHPRQGVQNMCESNADIYTKLGIYHLYRVPLTLPETLGNTNVPARIKVENSRS